MQISNVTSSLTTNPSLTDQVSDAASFFNGQRTSSSDTLCTSTRSNSPSECYMHQQVLGCESQEMLVLNDSLTNIFQTYAGELVDIEIYNSRICRVEVYMAEGKAVIGTGWELIQMMLGLEVGDIAYFAKCGYRFFAARFFDQSGKERMAHISQAQDYAAERFLSGIDAHEPDDLTGSVLATGLTWTPFLCLAVRDILFVRQTGDHIYVNRLNHSATSRGMLYFNKEFSSVHFKEESNIACIRVDGTGETSKGRIIFGRDGIARLNSGWSSVVSSHKLHEGDICAFAFRREIGFFQITVHILARVSTQPRS